MLFTVRFLLKKNNKKGSVDKFPSSTDVNSFLSKK